MNGHRACLFCQRRDRKITGEHLIGQWLTRLVGPGTYRAIRSTSDMLRRETRTIWQTDKVVDLKITEVCVACNEELGSVVEEPARIALTPLIQGQATSLTREAQNAIGLWIYKVGVLYRYAAQPRRAASREELDDVFVRRSLRRGTRVHVARYEGRYTVKLISYLVGMATDLERRELSPPEAADKRELVTLVVGPLVIHLSLYSAPSNWAFGTHGAVVRQVWPSIGLIDWPPPMPVDDGGLDALAETVFP